MIAPEDRLLQVYKPVLHMQQAHTVLVLFLTNPFYLHA